MKRKLIFAIVVMGFSGIIAEIVLLRELVITFHGNELSIGVILANWLLLESAGAYFLGKKVSLVRRKLGLFILLTILFTIFFIAAIYAARIFKDYMSVIPGEGLGIMPMFYISFIILLPVSLLHGALFTWGCKLYFLYSSSKTSATSQDKLSAFSISRVYIYETLGTMIGGVILTYLLIPYLHSIKIAFVLALLNFGICAYLLKPFWKPNITIQKRIASIFLFSLLPITIYVILSSHADQLHFLSLEQQWKNHNLVHYENSPFGNIVVTEREDEYTFFTDGLPVITSPNPDLVYVEEFAHLPMLSHSDPGNIMILSGGAGGIINEILKHDVSSIDYTEADPLLPEVVKKYSTPLTEKEFLDPRVNIEKIDGRFFLKRSENNYDIIFSGFTDPTTLHTNRFFTQEFFSLAKDRLTSDGILVLGLPGSLTYLSSELIDLNALVLNTLESVFPYVEVIPGELNNFYLASGSQSLKDTGPAEMIERKEARNLEVNMLTPDYIEYKLHARWLDFYFSNIDEGTDNINYDFKPLGVFYSLVYWNEKFSPSFNEVFKQGEQINLYSLGLVFLIFFLIFYTIFSRIKNFRKPALSLCIFSTGFAGMLFDLILIFAFQVLFGYIFYWLGLLVTAFMAGVMVGGMWMSSYLKKVENAAPAIIKLELILIVFALLLPWIFLNAGALLVHTWFDQILRLIFLILSGISGVLVGAEFPLANKEYLKISPNLSGTAGLLYSSDLLGGWLGGIIGGVLLLPILGLVETSMVIIMFKIISLALLLISIKKER